MSGKGRLLGVSMKIRVPPEQRNRIFEPHSAEALRSATGYESSGLGLAFCTSSRSRRRAVLSESRTAHHGAACSSSSFPLRNRHATPDDRINLHWDDLRHPAPTCRCAK